jgi:hypothetical protein
LRYRFLLAPLIPYEPSVAGIAGCATTLPAVAVHHWQAPRRNPDPRRRVFAKKFQTRRALQEICSEQQCKVRNFTQRLFRKSQGKFKGRVSDYPIDPADRRSFKVIDASLAPDQTIIDDIGCDDREPCGLKRTDDRAIACSRLQNAPR